MKPVDNPEISVIMSVYNGEKYIARALLSILSQSYTNFEIILIDDGSSDGTAKVVEKIKDDRLIFIRQQNMGLTKTLNRALTLAKGRFIARHDADDFSISTRFALQIQYLAEHHAVGLLGSSCFIQPAKHGIINEIYDYPQHHDEIMSAFPVYNPFVHGAMMIRRELLEENGGYNESYRYVQDYELWSRLLSKTRAQNLSNPLYVRSVHDGTSQVQIDKEPIFNEIRDAYLKQRSAEQHPVAVEGAVVRQIKSISIYPTISVTGGWNRSIAATLFQMARLARSNDLPWTGYGLQSIIYCPWLFL